MALVPFSTSTIRTEIKTLADAISSAELYPGYLTKPSSPDNAKVPSYYIELGDALQGTSDTQYQYMKVPWSITAFYDDPQDVGSVAAVDNLIDQLRVTFANRNESLNDSILNFEFSDMSVSGDENMEWGGRIYKTRKINFTAFVRDEVRS